MEEETVDVIEIWMPSDTGEIIVGYKPMKLIARIIDGIPIYLEKDFGMERHSIPKIESDKLLATP
jgi:hypothetical protein